MICSCHKSLRYFSFPIKNVSFILSLILHYRCMKLNRNYYCTPEKMCFLQLGMAVAKLVPTRIITKRAEIIFLCFLQTSLYRRCLCTFQCWTFLCFAKKEKEHGYWRKERRRKKLLLLDKPPLNFFQKNWQLLNKKWIIYKCCEQLIQSNFSRGLNSRTPACKSISRRTSMEENLQSF